MLLFTKKGRDQKEEEKVPRQAQKNGDCTFNLTLFSVLEQRCKVSNDSNITCFKHPSELPWSWWIDPIESMEHLHPKHNSQPCGKGGDNSCGCRAKGSPCPLSWLWICTQFVPVDPFNQPTKRHTKKIEPGGNYSDHGYSGLASSCDHHVRKTTETIPKCAQKRTIHFWIGTQTL